MAIEAGHVTREDIFVTTKVWMNNYHRVVESFEESLTAMGLDYVDLLLVHWPNSELGDSFSEEPVVKVPMHKVWA